MDQLSIPPISADKVSKCCQQAVTRTRDSYWSEKHQEYRRKTVYACSRGRKNCQLIDACSHYPVPHTVTPTGSGNVLARCAKCGAAYRMQ